MMNFLLMSSLFVAGFLIHQLAMYGKNGLSSITIYTTILIWMIIFLCVISLIQCLAKRNSLFNRHNTTISILSSMIILSFFVFDLSLRFIFKKHLVYNELNGDTYYESFHQEDYGRHYTYLPASTIQYETEKFNYVRKTNSLGIVNEEIKLEKPANEYRILCLGDSFTEGVGATSAKSPWPYVLYKLLHAKSSKKINVINAGISGSDLAFQYILLKEKFTKYKPDLLLIAINPVDIDEFIVRGGLERFNSKDLLRGKQSPWWEPLYAGSFVFRFFIHDVINYNYLFLSPENDRLQREDARKKIIDTLSRFQQLSLKSNMEMIFIVHPDSGKDYYNNPNVTHDLAKDILSQIDIRIIDLMLEFKNENHKNHNNIMAHFWPTSFHHNDLGYSKIAQIIYKKIKNDKILKKKLGL